MKDEVRASNTLILSSKGGGDRLAPSLSLTGDRFLDALTGCKKHVKGGETALRNKSA